MIRFVDLGTQLGIDEEWPREFAFYNTITSCFLNFSGSETWASWELFENDFTESLFWLDTGWPIERFRGVCHEWVFNVPADVWTAP